jgi:Rrf2 family protein
LILNISEAANLGIHALAYLASQSTSAPVTTASIAAAYDVSEAHLSKVFQRLSKAGLVKSVRGPHGGFRLSRPAARITLREIYEALDGPIGKSDCLLGKPRCGLARCVFGDLLTDVQRRVSDHLSGTTLAEVAANAQLKTFPYKT